MNSKLSKMNKNLASMHDEKEKANAMAKKVKILFLLISFSNNNFQKVESRNSSRTSRNSNYKVTVTVSNITEQVLSERGFWGYPQ